MSFRILGTGSSVPKKVLTNEELSKIVDTSDEWITTRTGIKTRYISEDETPVSLSYEASIRALQEANIDAKDLDLIICATLSADYLSPSLACLIQKEIGATCPAFDLNAACTGFIYALDVADSYFKCGKVKKVLVVAFEALSKFLNWEDRTTCVLFGDGCGAVVLGEGNGLLHSQIHAQGDSGSLNIADLGEGKPVVHMIGKDIYKFAVSSGSTDIPIAIEKSGLTQADVDHVILHQANKRIIEAVSDRLEIPKERYAINIEEYGNTSSASIPLTLDKMNKNNLIKDGDIIVMTAFGGGLTTGTCVIQWNKGEI